MPKKLFFVFLLAALTFSACAPKQTESNEIPGSIVDSDRMPCTTVFEFDTTAETDHYQTIVDKLPPFNEDDWVRGNLDAPITIFEYADMQCPACVGFAQYTSALLEYFPNSIKVVFRHLPLPSIHDKAIRSGLVIEAAGNQGKFWEMHDFLYATQNDWFSMPEDEFVDWIVGQTAFFDLDADQFEKDILDEEKYTWLEDLTNERLGLGLNYTPTVVINGRIFRDNNPNVFGLLGIYEFGGFEECPKWVIDPAKSYTAKVDTNVGEIEIKLYADKAPLAVNSFVFLAQNGWYNGVYFHRVLPGFVAQAGDPSGLGMIGPGYTFDNEIDGTLSFDGIGILGMANSGVDTNGSQFFITLGPATDLDGDYTIFGKVSADSISLLDSIALRDPQTTDDFDAATMIKGVEIIEQ